MKKRRKMLNFGRQGNRQHYEAERFGDVPRWMQEMKKERHSDKKRREKFGIKRKDIDTTPLCMKKTKNKSQDD